MHALRHFYASSLFDAGESIRALVSYLGHADPGFTLRVYTHLMPASEERTRQAVDHLFQPAAEDPGLRVITAIGSCPGHRAVPGFADDLA
ncbi:hypothetical protein [Micromonospora sp. CA-246542]|uniref:hypothetical protein n=1 Tax=Micromonospora sp. CA-246542 TaxID=3239959 RepID=UPI003D8A7D39